jgi:hypothetical protein
MADLYLFFGGIIESDIMSSNASLDGQCEADGTCGKSISDAPLPDVPDLSEWRTLHAPTGTYATFYMDLTDINDAKVHVVSSDPNVNGTLFHEVFSGDHEYNYNTQDLLGWDGITEAPALLEAGYDIFEMVKVKENCEVDSWYKDRAFSNAKSAYVLQTYADGSATWKVGDWEVTVGADGLVSNIDGLDVLSIASYSGSQIGPFAMFDTCNPDVDYVGDFLGHTENLGRRRMEAMTEEEAEEHRRLAGCNLWDAAVAFYETGAEYGQFCGKGYPGHCSTYGKSMHGVTLNNPGAGSVANFQVCNDGGLDASCAKHDSGTKHEDLWGVATMNWCEVDREFAVYRNSKSFNFHDGEGPGSAVVNGANCLFNLMPCLAYECSTKTVSCGKGCSNRQRTCKEVHKWPPTHGAWWVPWTWSVGWGTSGNHYPRGSSTCTGSKCYKKCAEVDSNGNCKECCRAGNCHNC